MVAVVQAAEVTEARRKSNTELARVVAAHRGWSFDETDQLCDAGGAVIAWTLEDAAEAMVELGWIVEVQHVVWTAIPRDGVDAAHVLRGMMTPGQMGPVYGPRWQA